MEQKADKAKIFVSAVIYCHNNADTIGDLIKGLNITLDNNYQSYEMIVVNDASNDDSTDVLKKAASQLESKTITLLNFKHCQGLEKAMNAGLDLAIGDFVYEFDSAFLDFDWGIVFDAYKKSTSESCDIVCVRSTKKSSISSRLFYYLLNHYSGFKYQVATDTFRLVSRRAINRIRKNTQSVPYRKAAYASCGLTMGSIYYTPAIEVKRPLAIGRKQAAYDSMVLYTDVAYRATGSMAIIVFGLFLCILIMSIIGLLAHGEVNSWMIVGSLLSLGFAFLFVVLAFILKYIQTFVVLYFQKNSYRFDSIEKL